MFIFDERFLRSLAGAVIDGFEDEKEAMESFPR